MEEEAVAEDQDREGMVADTELQPATQEPPDEEKETILELYPVDDYMDATSLGLGEPALVEKPEEMEEIKPGENECSEVPEASIAAETLVDMEREQEEKLVPSPICVPGMAFHGAFLSPLNPRSVFAHCPVRELSCEGLTF